MATEIGEYLVDLYLRLLLQCGLVDYNASPQAEAFQVSESLMLSGSILPANAISLSGDDSLDGLLIGKGTNSSTNNSPPSIAAAGLCHPVFEGLTPRYMFSSPFVRAVL